MTFSHSYTSELEELILGTLLPAYERYQKSKGIHNPLKGINPELLAKIEKPKRVAALLLPSKI